MNLWEVSEKSEKLDFIDFERGGPFEFLIEEFPNTQRKNSKGGPFQNL